MTSVAVVHLVRAVNGVEPFRRFLESYRAHEAGREHRLVLLCKGFDREDELHEYRRLLDGQPHELVRFPDKGYDVGPYFSVARALDYDYFCFLNSFSVIRSDRWLAKLYAHASRADVGLVGATGSYASNFSAAQLVLGLPSAYTGVLEVETVPPPPVYRGLASALLLRRLRQWLSFERKLRPYRIYPPFPAPHLRTNAFMISRALAAGVRCGPIRNKEDAYRFESGKYGLTRQIHARGLKTLVVGADGEGYDVEQWPDSETLYQRMQENLLVADNVTIAYETCDAAGRRSLSLLAWGKRANPAP